jgi:hypothetical protein
MNNIMDPLFNGMPGGQMYRGWAFPDIIRDQPKPRFENWEPEDLIAYVGGEYA